MKQEQYTKLVDYKYNCYVGWGYNLDAIAQEVSMINGSPDSHFHGGADEKLAALHALDLLEVKLLRDGEPQNECDDCGTAISQHDVYCDDCGKANHEAQYGDMDNHYDDSVWY